MTKQKLIENSMVLPKVDKHLRDAPNWLAEYVLNSWFQQYQDGQVDLFYFRERPKEGRLFWDEISCEHWSNALYVADINDWWKKETEEKEEPKESALSELEKSIEEARKEISEARKVISSHIQYIKSIDKQPKDKPDWLNPPLKVGDKVKILEWWSFDERNSNFEIVCEISEVTPYNLTYRTKDGIRFCDIENNRDKWVKL